MTASTIHIEEHRVTGTRLLERVKALVHEGNTRRIIVKNDDGVVLMEFPLTVGLVGAVLQPMIVAVGALAALAAHYRIAVESEAGPVPPESTVEEAARCFHCRDDV